MGERLRQRPAGVMDGSSLRVFKMWGALADEFDHA